MKEIERIRSRGTRSAQIGLCMINNRPNGGYGGGHCSDGGEGTPFYNYNHN